METRPSFSAASHAIVQPPSRMPDQRVFPRPTFNNINYRMIPELRALNSALFPVAYNDKFYADVLATKEYAHAAFIEDQLAGAICCRRETNSWDSSYRVYVMTIGVRPQYRRLGIASTLVQRVISHARTDPNCTEIALHVQTSNLGALDFYDRLGFIRQELVPDYYLQLNPTSAYFLTFPFNRAKEVDDESNGSELGEVGHGVFREGVEG
ncbi:acyl-CoA N-acyltransferase [Catenaria anguillulae PL171]|uniref:Acyl-CoA N-acyltransferase n=1 Tax=Catenaria anguillulae PL171 TaxID=765915 RepID=A0A1Y2HNU2_9FUNG|nr:acyl-CoA N-acyltransferase [Catenaria anguillulae PL171]